MISILLLIITIISPTNIEADATVTWKQLPNVDNFGYDIRNAGTTDVESLKTTCGDILYCCGFSSAFGLLKFNCSQSTLGPQPNTILYVKSKLPPPLPPAPSHDIWPLPNYMDSKAKGNLTIDPNTFDFKISPGSPTSKELAAAILRYHSLLFPENKRQTTTPTTTTTTTTTLSGLTITLMKNGDTPLTLNVDESYNLTIPFATSQNETTTTVRGTLQANTVWGLLHGLSTFAQLVRYPTLSTMTLPNVPLTIIDAPRFSYRGLMIDTARHYWPMRIIYEHLDLMESTKMNVLHWHMVDGQAFSFNSTSHPKLPFLSSYDSKTATYSHENVRDVVAYGLARGITIIPEFDMPSHDYAWTYAYPELKGDIGDHYDGIDPTSDFSYTFVDELFAELSTIFDGQHIHVGGDEVALSSWKNSPSVQKFMTLNNISSVVALESYWFEKLAELAKKYNKTLMTWHDPIANGAKIPIDAIVEVWGGSLEYANELAQGGHQIVYAAPFYLDAVGKQWTDFYAAPFGGQLMNMNLSSNLIGGEAAMWSEWVDETNSIARIWPRTAAIAEVLWSKPNSGNPLLFELSAKRLAQWRCRMRKWGFSPEPVGPMQGGPFYCSPDAYGWENANVNRRNGGRR